MGSQNNGVEEFKIVWEIGNTTQKRFQKILLISDHLYIYMYYMLSHIDECIYKDIQTNVIK